MARMGGVPAANRYADLTTDPKWSGDYEIQEGLPVDGSNEMARKLSPFVIEVVPPSIYANELVSRGGPVTVGIVDHAATSYSTFSRAKSLRGTRGQGDSLVSGAQIDNRLKGRAIDLKTFIANGRLQTTGETGAYSDPAIADQMAAADLAIQLKGLESMPPLTLLTNPSSLSISYTKVQQYSERNRSEYIFQAWGEEQPRMSVSGKIGAFIAGASGPATLAPKTDPTTFSPSGAQWASKRNSASWQNLMSLFSFYKSNGYIYDTLGKSYAMHMVGALAITYDRWTYIGHMESFEYGFEADKPNGGLEFSFEFTISRMFDSSPSQTVILPLNAPMSNPADGNLLSGTDGTGFGLGGEFLADGGGVADSVQGDLASTALPHGGGGNPQTGASESVPPGTGSFTLADAASPDPLGPSVF